MDEPQEQREMSLGEWAGLGTPFALGAAGWKFIKVPKQADPNLPQLYILKVWTTAGIFGIGLTEDDLRKFIGEAMDAQSGITLPSPADLDKLRSPGL